jgi:outer membrane lipoprotein SlyB
MILLLLLAAAVMAFGTAGCEDEVKVQRSYEGEAPPPSQTSDEGEVVRQRSVQIESEGFDEDDAGDDDEVKIHRSSETSTETREMQVTP